MINVIKQLLYKIISDLDAGNSELSEKECIEIVDHLITITNKNEKLSKYQAAKYINVSRATFDNYVRDGKLPAGKKQQGFKEIF